MNVFAYCVIGFNLLATVAGLLIPHAIAMQANAKFAEFGIEELTADYSAARTRELMPEIVMGTSLSLVGVILGIGLVRRKEWARKGWLFVCACWLLAALSMQILEPDLSMTGLAPLILRAVIFGISYWVLLSPSGRKEFCANT